MTIVCIDSNVGSLVVGSDQWRSIIRREFRENSSIKVAVSKGRFLNELRKVSKIKEWLIELDRSGQISSIAEAKVLEIELYILTNVPAVRHESCDDLHIFSLIFASGASYLFTKDKRLGTCRSRMRKNRHGKKFTNFSTIMNDKVYKRHRQTIIRT